MSTPSVTRSSLVVYGSETGNAQDVAAQVHDLFRRLRYKSQLLELDAVKGLGDLLKYTVVVFVISTTGQGHLPANAQKFWKAVRRARLPVNCFQRLKFTSFGLGDRNYSKFNWAHRKLYNRLIQLSANPIFERGEGDEQHAEGINGDFLPWLTQLEQSLLFQYPLPDGVDPIPKDELLPPEWVLRLGEGTSISASTSITPPPSSSNALSSGGIPITVTVCENTRVTPDTHWQDVRHLILKAEDVHDYNPGDVLSIQPKNFPDDVDRFMDLMDLSLHQDQIVHFDRPGSEPTTDPSSPSPPVSLPPDTTLRSFLTNYLDIMSIPRPSFFSLLYHFCSDPDHKERLAEFADPAMIDDLFDYTTRPRRSILEILHEFSSVKIPLEWLPTVIPLMGPRQFSIASGGSLKHPTPNTTIFELLVAIVKYRTVIKRTRQGVCTRYLATWAPGEKHIVSLRSGTMAYSSADFERPAIMVGPGTGVAPMRSLIWERFSHFSSLPKAAQPTDILFFGCRNSKADYFFSTEWANITSKSSSKFEVFPAFSRDQRAKVYVQDLIRQHSSQIHQLLQHERGGVVYVCGSSGKMPESIREALKYVFQTGGKEIKLVKSENGLFMTPADDALPISREDAERELADLERAGRFREDTW